MRTLFTLIVLLLMSSNIFSFDLTLNDAKKLALDHSFELKKAKVTSDAYNESIKVQKANRFPTLSVDAYTVYNSRIAELNMDVMGFDLNREIGSKDVYQVDVQLAVPIYTGGKITSGINLARATFEMNKYLESATEDKVLYLVNNEYLRLKLADLMIVAAKSSFDRIKIIEKDIKTAYEAGIADSLSLVEIGMKRFEAELAVNQSETNRRYHEIILLSMLGKDLNESLTLVTPLDEPNIEEVDYNGVNDSKSELMALSQSIEINRQNRNIYKSSYYPSISLFGGFSYGKPNVDMFSGDFNDNLKVGASFNWSFNLGRQTSSRVRMSEYQITSAENEYNRIDEELNQRAKTALENLKLANQKYQTESKRFELAKQYYHLAKIQNEAGSLSSNRLLEVEHDLVISETNMQSSKVDYQIILALYNYIIGEKNNE